MIRPVFIASRLGLSRFPYFDDPDTLTVSPGSVVVVVLPFDQVVVTVVEPSELVLLVLLITTWPAVLELADSEALVDALDDEDALEAVEPPRMLDMSDMENSFFRDWRL